MYKREKGLICSFEIFLLISMSFAIAFILEENFVTGQELGSAALTRQLEEFTIGNAYKAPPITQIPAPSFRAVPAAADKPASVVPGRGPFEFVTDLFKGKAFGTPTGIPAGTSKFTGLGLTNTLVGALAWAGIAYAAGQLLGGLLGLEDAQTNALSYALAGGAFTYAGLEFAVTNQLLVPGKFLYTGAFNFLAGVGIAAAIFI